MDEDVDMSQDRLRNELMHYMFVKGDEVDLTNHSMTVFKLFVFTVVLLFTGKYAVVAALYIL